MSEKIENTQDFSNYNENVQNSSGSLDSKQKTKLPDYEENVFFCMICGSKMVYNKNKRRYECPKCKKVKFDEQYMPNPAYCYKCNAPLAYGNFKGIRRFFCINPDCPSYSISLDKGTLPDEKEEEDIVKVDYNGIFTFVLGLDNNKLYIVNTAFNIDSGYLQFKNDLEEMPHDCAQTSLLKNRIANALEYFFNLSKEERDKLLYECFRDYTDDRYNVIRSSSHGFEIVPGLIYADMWGVVLTPLLSAITNKDHNQLKKLLSDGADVEEINYNKLTPLEWAAYRNNTKAIQLLLEYGANINAKGSDNQTPLLAAASGVCLEAMELLLKMGAKVSLGSDIGETPLMRAAGENSINGIKLLLEYGANVDERQNGGQTALMLAASYNALDAVKYLVEHGATVNARDSKQATPLMYAAAYDGEETVKFLLENGAELEAEDSDGVTPLINAAAYNASNAVKILVDAGAKINAADKRKRTPLLYATDRSSLKMVKFLIEHGADINIQDMNGENALMYAVQLDATEIVKLLLENGADVNAKDKNGNTALQLAIKAQEYPGDFEVIPILKKYIASSSKINK